MANAIYDKAREKFLSCGTTVGTTVGTSIDWANDNIKMVLVQTGVGHYVVNLATHEFLSDIVVGDRINICPNLTGKTITAGVADCNDPTFSSVTGAVAGAIVVYKDTGTAGTSPLICYLDTLTGLPVTPNGGDLIFQVDNGASRLFKL